MDTKKTYVIGVDVGGTNTDAVILEYPTKTVINAIKTITTKDFISGILIAIKEVLITQKSVSEHQIVAIMIGTTTFLNAIVQFSDDLRPVIVIRLCGPLTKEYPPFTGFPEKLKQKLQNEYFYIDGGVEYNNENVLPLSESQIIEVAKKLVTFSKSGKDLNIVIIGVFGSLFSRQEVQAYEILKNEFEKEGIKDYNITLSHKIGQTGFLERENASILNASLKYLANKTIKQIESSLKILKLSNCENRVFLTQNDGTIINAHEAIDYPVFTFNGGPVNSLRGATVLANLQDALIADIGGTTTDIAVLEKGFPRPSSTYSYVAGIRTNFRMPDTISIGLGGGSLVKFSEDGKNCSIGPKSVGYRLLQEAQCFGGKILTASDVAVLRMPFAGADPSKVKLTQDEAAKAENAIIRKLENTIDKMKTKGEDVPLILVGGGSVIIPDQAKIKGISKLIKPSYFDVANAIGAAIAQVSVTIEEVCLLEGKNRAELIENVKQKAIHAVKAKGAIEKTIETFHDAIHLAYVKEESLRIICKAVGELDLLQYAQENMVLSNSSEISSTIIEIGAVDPFIEDNSKIAEDDFDLPLTDPKIVENNGHKEWILTLNDLEYMSIGAGIMAAGGGGSTYAGKLEVLNFLKKGKEIRVISTESMKEGDYAIWCAHYGAPLMISERLGSVQKIINSFEIIKKLAEKEGKRVAAVMPVEIGGMNSMAPLCVAAELDIPVLDCDLMGRAFPELQMITPFFYGIKPYPLCMCNDFGDSVIRDTGDDPKEAELFFRKTVMGFGCDGSISGIPLSKEFLINYGLRNTLSQIWKLGRHIVEARKKKINPLTFIEEKEKGKLIFVGKIIDVDRRNLDGYNKGSCKISGLDDFANQTLHVDFQNENLTAILTYDEEPNKKKVLAIVPDIISLVDLETYQPILTEETKYGLRVSVLVLPVSPLLKSPEALKLISPKAFGYDYDYEALGGFSLPKSIIDG